MKMVLYLTKIDQAVIDAGRGEGAQMGSMEPWPRACRILDLAMLMSGETDAERPRPGFIMRKEGKGGMLWDPRSGSVYLVDDEAYHAMLDLDRGHTTEEVAGRLKVPITAVERLTAELRNLGS